MKQNVQNVPKLQERQYRNMELKNSVVKKLNAVTNNTVLEKVKQFKSFRNQHKYFIDEYGIRVSIDFRPTSHKIFSVCFDHLFMFDLDYSTYVNSLGNYNRSSAKNTVVKIMKQFVDSQHQKGVYSLPQLESYVKKGKIPFISWNNIEYLPSLFFQDDIIFQATEYIKQLNQDYHYKSSKLKRILYLLQNVHNRSTSRKVICHVRTNGNVKSLLTTCAAHVLLLKDYFETSLENKSNNEKKNLIEGDLAELDQMLDVCMEGSCNDLLQFIQQKQSNFKFNFNSTKTIDANINEAAMKLVQMMCKSSKTEADFRMQFSDIITRLRGLLIDKIASGKKIDYMDIEEYVLNYGAMLQEIYCNNEEFSNKPFKILTSQGEVTL